MNISPSALLAIVVATTIANVLILVMVSLRSKNNRARRLAAVETMLSTSYFEGGPAQPRPGPAPNERDQGADAPEPETQAAGDAPDGIERTDAATHEEAWVTMEHETYSVEGSADEARAADDANHQTIDADQSVAVADDTVATNEPVAVEVPAPVEEPAPVEKPAPVEMPVAADEPVADEEPVAADEPVATEEPVLAAEPLRGAAGNGSIIGRDPLTGLLDALAFNEVLVHEDAREQRYGRPATVVMFELDGLSKIVDRLGPNTGDRIEVALADTIARLARRADYVARLEAGRYGVLLPETDEIAAINYVERIRRACDLWLESGAIAMRLAIGWASSGGDIQPASAIRTATDRMRLESRRNARMVDEDATKDVAVAETVAVGGSDLAPNGL